MSEQPDLDQSIRSACDAKDFDTAATLAIEGYTSEIASFLEARLRSRSDAKEVFSMFAEDLWMGLPQFGWRCSMRAWAYTLARNAASRYLRSPHGRPRNNLTLSQPGRLSALVDRVRTATHAYQRTDVKDRFRALRERLSDDDQLLLILRIDRDLRWRDIAIAMSGNADLDDNAIDRESARVRKVFERVKADLKRMAREEGLLGPDS